MTDEVNSGAPTDGPPNRQAAPSPQVRSAPPAGELCAMPGPAVTVALRDVLEPALAAALRRRLSADCGVHLVDISLSSPQDFRRNVQEPTCCYTLTVGPLRAGDERAGRASGCLWVDVGAEIAHPILDVLLGGSGGRVLASDRPLTAVERRLLRRLPEATAECLSAALVQVGESVRLAEGPVAASWAGPAAVLTFRLSCRGADGAVRVCVPVTLLEAMLPSHLAELGQWAAIELSAALPDASLPASEAASLEVGDIVTTDTPVDGEVTVRLAGVAKFAARLGACDGHRAITITRPLLPPKQD
ncbi:MAG: FliM/FliN family flagellar motor switch protein [Phycisphaerae bacterium]|nr:FliM/FliN family flagellar motor switch protein [Phycisphaerae bacterium]